jgi:mono/diheme cytochrome c family protein
VGAAFAAGTPYEVTVRPFLRENCAPCHNAKFASGDLNIERLAAEDAADSLKERSRWENMIRRMRAGEMPPKNAKRPAEPQISAVADWVEAEYARLDRETQ